LPPRQKREFGPKAIADGSAETVAGLAEQRVSAVSAY
jgi:hypothetical protein